MNHLMVRTREAQALQGQVSNLARRLQQAKAPEDIIKIEALLDGIETTMRQSGLYSTTEIRPVVETRMWARWKLGRALDQVERGHGPGRGKKVLSDSTSFRAILRKLTLDVRTAMEAHRIGTLPEPELRKRLEAARDADDLVTFTELIDLARPYWYQASRARKHRQIKSRAAAQQQVDLAQFGPFPLLYADPPWKWGHFGEPDQENEKGKARTPDQHYPTLTYDEICNFQIAGKSISEIAHRDAALFLWCTSANLELAVWVMKAWGFTYKTHAVWVKDKPGMGLVFRNQHETLLYGTRGNMPGPQFQPSSVFQFPRSEHSVKPAEVRAAIEKMYPDFDATTRLELFARESPPGWTVYGNEVVSKPTTTVAAEQVIGAAPSNAAEQPIITKNAASDIGTITMDTGIGDEAPRLEPPDAVAPTLTTAAAKQVIDPAPPTAAEPHTSSTVDEAPPPEPTPNAVVPRTSNINTGTGIGDEAPSMVLPPHAGVPTPKVTAPCTTDKNNATGIDTAISVNVATASNNIHTSTEDDLLGAPDFLMRRRTAP